MNIFTDLPVETMGLVVGLMSVSLKSKFHGWHMQTISKYRQYVFTQQDVT